MKLNSFPRPGKDNPAEAVAWALGGSAANTASLLARLRVPTGVIGRVGKDKDGQALVRELKRLGIHTAAIQRDPERATGMCIIPVTADGERTLIGSRGANRGLIADGILETLGDFQHLHVDGYVLLEPEPRRAALRALEKARLLGATTSLDFSWLAALHVADAIRQALPLVTVALPSASELRLALGARQLRQAAERALELGVEQVAATLGPGGSRIFMKQRSFRIPPFPTSATNTTGAGDAFNAGYIVGLLHGASPIICGVLANVAGAAAVSSERPYETIRAAELVERMRARLGSTRPKWLAPALDEAIRLLKKSPSRIRRRRR